MGESSLVREESHQRTIEAVKDLSNLLQLSESAAQRLKKDIESENFPLAYKLSKSIHILREAVDELKNNVECNILDLSFKTHFHESMSHSDSLASSDRL